MKKLGNLILLTALVLVCLLLLPTEAKAASVEDLTFALNKDGESYSVTGCDTSASGELVIPATYNSLPVTSIGDYAFVDGLSFYGCTRLTSVTIPDSVTSIGMYAFQSCTGLTSITVPDSVTSIGEGVFLYCTNLTSITIPDSVTSIGGRAFLRCDSLTDVYYTGTQEQWDAIAFGSYNECLTSATLHLVSGDTHTHSYDESGVCACGATRATVSVVEDEVVVNANGTAGIKIHAFNITGKEVDDINVWNQLKAADPNFKTYTKSSFALKNGTYVLRIQYTDAEGTANVISEKITVDYTPAPVIGPAITVENNVVSVTNNDATNVKIFAFNVTGKEVADIDVWNQLKAADPNFKTYTKSSFALKNGDYVLRVQYTDVEGVTHTESQAVTVNVQSVVPQTAVSGKIVTVGANGADISKIHVFCVEGKEIADTNSWNELKAADASFKSYRKSQFSVKNSGAYVLRIEYVDQYGIAQTVSQLITAQ